MQWLVTNRTNIQVMAAALVAAYKAQNDVSLVHNRAYIYSVSANPAVVTAWTAMVALPDDQALLCDQCAFEIFQRQQFG